MLNKHGGGNMGLNHNTITLKSIELYEKKGLISLNWSQEMVDLLLPIIVYLRNNYYSFETIAKIIEILIADKGEDKDVYK